MTFKFSNLVELIKEFVVCKNIRLFLFLTYKKQNVFYMKHMSKTKLDYFYFKPEWDIVSIMEFCEKIKIKMGGIINKTATADPAPTRAIPPAAIVLNTDGSIFKLSSYI